MYNSRGLFCPMPGAPPPMSKRSMVSGRSVVSEVSITTEREEKLSFQNEGEESHHGSVHDGLVPTTDYGSFDLDSTNHLDHELIASIPEYGRPSSSGGSGSQKSRTSSRPEYGRTSCSSDSDQERSRNSNTENSSTIRDYQNKYEMAIKKGNDSQRPSIESESSHSSHRIRSEKPPNGRSDSFRSKSSISTAASFDGSTRSGVSDSYRKHSSVSGETAPKNNTGPSKSNFQHDRNHSFDSTESHQITGLSSSDIDDEELGVVNENRNEPRSKTRSGPYRKQAVESTESHQISRLSSSEKYGEELGVRNENKNEPESQPRRMQTMSTGLYSWENDGGTKKGRVSQTDSKHGNDSHAIQRVASMEERLAVGREIDASRAMLRAASVDESSLPQKCSRNSSAMSYEETRMSIQSCGVSCSSKTQTIALLGASGMTGGRFLHSALDAGYQVKCVPSDDPRQTSVKNQPWKILQAEMEDTKQLEILVSGANYVVVMMNDLFPKKSGQYPDLFLTRLVGKLYALMRREDSMQVFFLQSTSLASNLEGRTPILSKVVKSTTRRGDPFMRDLDSAMKKIATEHCIRTRSQSNDENKDPNPTPPQFSFLVTRPTILLQNGPGCKRLFASKSQPGPVPISHVDLAEFSLNALTTTKLYNSSPYIVADCF